MCQISLPFVGEKNCALEKKLPIIALQWWEMGTFEVNNIELELFI